MPSDLFIMEEDRRRGLGKHTFEVLARIAQGLDCARFQWMVSMWILLYRHLGEGCSHAYRHLTDVGSLPYLQALDWNTPALQFYDKIGGHQLPSWLTLRMYRKDIESFIGESTP